MGDGKSINIWDDKWIPTREAILAESIHQGNTDIKFVSEFIDSNTKKWNLELLLSLFDNSIVQEINNIRLYTNAEG